MKQNKLTILDDQDNKPLGDSPLLLYLLSRWHLCGCRYISDYVDASTVSIAISVPKLEDEQEERKLHAHRAAWEGKQ